MAASAQAHWWAPVLAVIGAAALRGGCARNRSAAVCRAARCTQPGVVLRRHHGLLRGGGDGGDQEMLPKTQHLPGASREGAAAPAAALAQPRDTRVPLALGSRPGLSCFFL